MATYFSGRVHSVVYDNPGGAFYIVKMILDQDEDDFDFLMPVFNDPVTVKGNVPGMAVQIGTWFGFEGKWITHPQYGRQLDITRAPVLLNGWTPDTAAKTLSANGVGPSVIASIRNHFGDDKLLVALNSAEMLEEVPGLAKFSALHVAERWEVVQANFKALDFLSTLGLPAGRVKEIWSHFGDTAEKVLTKNPWALVEVDGITFHQADSIARKMGISDVSSQIRGSVLYACKNNRSFGHMYLRTGSIFHAVRVGVPDATKADIAKSLAGLHKDGLIVIDKTTRPGTAAIYEPWGYTMEEASARQILDRVETARFGPEDERTDNYIRDICSVGPKTAEASTQKRNRLGHVLKTAVDEWGGQAKLVLSDEQKEGVYNALTAPVSILAGLPGTGKTTSLRAAVRILQDAGIPFLLVAPTGIAAKNLAARTGATASTIHRAFKAMGASDDRREAGYAGITGRSKGAVAAQGGGEWGYGSEHTHPAEVVIVDEASMVDQHLLYRLLDCTQESCRLVFVGDHAQLPSVGPGNVLRNLIESGAFPTVKLDRIFRQEDTSGIVYAAHAIHAGNMPETDKDFRLISRSSEDQVMETVCGIAERFYKARENFQILSPRHAGGVGVTNLNARLRELLNPKAPGLAEHRMGKDVLREGDRIMVVKNDYKLALYNGDVGKIARVDRGKKEVEIKIFGSPPLFVRIKFKDVPRLLRLAYACTVHKAQGLEYDRIVMPIVTGFHLQLQRNLLYTAITRARKQVVLVGQREALARAVANAKEDERATLFVDRLVGGLIPVDSE